ncbi:MAG: tetratricopeptide repeat protein [Chitinophagales bacterium]|nr:tetratricopeptide repeat protein [Chitinophagales bacterium]
MSFKYSKKLWLLLIIAILPFCSFAQKKKKSKTKSKSQYEQANFVQKAYGDITTRNNWYFNANELYKDILHRADNTADVDYATIIPFYFHDKDLSSYASEFQTIEKKMGIVLQIRNYGRWRDNCYLLLGKSQYLMQKYDTSLITFQYIVTTMKPDKLNAKVGLSNKERMKYLKQRQKEIAKKNDEKKKFIEFKWKEQQKANEQKVEDARDKQQAAIEKKKKELEEIIKAKKKIIALRKKGKKVPEKLIEIAKGKSSQDTIINTKIEDKVDDKKPNFDPKLPYVLIDDEYVKNPFYKDTTNRDEDKPLENLLSKKEEEQWDKLSFWEKIKHKKSRPEALVWMSKSLLELNRYADAQSMIAYGKALRKLTKKQRKDLYLVDAYYQLKRNNILLAIEKLENAMMLIKKKDEKAHYEFILAQLYSKNNQPADAIDYFEKSIKHTVDERMSFYSKLNMAKLIGEYPELASTDAEKMLNKLVRFGKNKEQADEVYYQLAQLYLSEQDTTQAIESLVTSIEKSISNQNQKGLSYLKLAQLNYDREQYANAKGNYDSTVTFLNQENENYAEASKRKTILDELNTYITNIHIQDSLQRLGKMSDKELKDYLASIEAAKEKAEKKKKNLSIEDNNISIVDPSAIQSSSSYTSNGLWYFYNDDIKGKGYTQFKSIWGDIQLQANWRRSQKSAFEEQTNQNNTNNNTNTNNQTTNTKKDTVVQYKIPKAPEEFIASDNIIAESLYKSGEIFKNKLNNIPKSKAMFDELIKRFPNSEYDAIAHYYLLLIYKEQNYNGLSDKEKQYILDNYPLSEIAEKIKLIDAPKATVEANANAAKSFYATTFEAFQNEDYDQVIANKLVAVKKYNGSAEIPQFDFLEALSYGKKQDLVKYKNLLSDIIIKYPNTAVQAKAQNYLMTLIQFQKGIEDTTANIQEQKPIVDTITRPKIEFVYDTTDFFIAIRLKDQYINIKNVLSKLQAFKESETPDTKLKFDPVFLEGNKAIILVKKFDTIEEVTPILMKLELKKQLIFGDKASKVDWFVISNQNFKLIKRQEDFDEYQNYFFKNYINK